MTLSDLLLRIRALAAPRRVERELDEELAFHIERETQKHIVAGLSPAEARMRARARFGPVPLAADECRDARGTAFVDDVTRDILYAFRTFRRAPLAALTIVATVALGLGLVTAVFAVYNLFVLRVDAVRNPGELFAVEMEERLGPDNEPDVVFTRPDYEAMRRETSVFTEAVAVRPTGARAEGRITLPVLVTGNFFQVLGAQPALGRPLTPDDDQPSAGPVIVLSHEGWRKLLRSDPAAIGRRLTIDHAQYEVVGVMPEDFRGLGITPPDYWVPMALGGQLGEYAAATDMAGVEIIGRLKPSISRQAAATALEAWASRRPEFTTTPGGEVQVRLISRNGTLPLRSGESLVMFSPLFFAFGLILMIGCANVANLLLARGVSRQREIGVRLSLGASRRRIVRQLLTESFLLALAAAACGLAISRLVVSGLIYALLNTIPADFAQLVSLINIATPASDWRVLVFLIVGAIVATMFFGVAPALQATRLELVPTMRGEVTRNAKPRRARHALIGVQVGASALLMICAAVFLRGAFASATRDPGMRIVDTLRVSVENEAHRRGVLEELRTHPLVAVVAGASPSSRGAVTVATSGISATAERRGTSSDYFDVLGYDLVSGRSFTPAERTPDAGVAVVTDTMSRQLWPNGNAVGEALSLETPARTLTVVGVVRNRERVVYFPTELDTAGTELLLRVRGNPEQARQALLERLTGLDPAFGVMTLRAMTSMQTYLLRGAFWVAVALGGLALVLTVSGLFSVLSYLVEQQAKEIGVRIALGAATKDVVRLVFSQSLHPVGIGLAAGVSLAAAVAIVLMATPAASEIGDIVHVFDPAAYAASVLVIVTSCGLAVSVPALRASRIDPIATMRQD